MNTLFVGIDISKDTLDIIGLDQHEQVVYPAQIADNSESGIAHILQQLVEFSNHSVWVCMEHTGVYGQLLLKRLSSAGVRCCRLNPLHLTYSLGLVRGKTDAIDARRIAQYALIHHKSLVAYVSPGRILEQLKVLMSTRLRLVKMLTSLKNGLKATQIAAKTLNLEASIELQEQAIVQLQQHIKEHERQMRALIDASESLQLVYHRLQSIIGVGPITAMMCVIETHNFTRFSNPRKFNCHCGLAPFAYQSGSSVRKATKTSPYRDPTLKAVLMQAAATAIQYDPQLKAYYHRKVQQGKAKLSVLNAVANKLVLRIFAVAKRDEPFVKLYP